MGDFVGQNARQLSLVCHSVNQTFGDDNIATGCGKRVVARVIKHAKGPFQVGSVRVKCNPTSQAVDVALQAHVWMQGLAAQQDGCQGSADFNLFGFVYLLDRLGQQLGDVTGFDA